MADLFDMGQYAGFLWSGWALTAAALGALVVFTVIERRRARRRLAQAEKRLGGSGGAS